MLGKMLGKMPTMLDQQRSPAAHLGNGDVTTDAADVRRAMLAARPGDARDALAKAAGRGKFGEREPSEEVRDARQDARHTCCGGRFLGDR